MREDLVNELLLLRDLGFTHLDLNNRSQIADRGSQEIETGQVTGEPELITLAREASVCTKCRLAGTRTQVVWGVGNPDADLMFIGEAPGRD
ncbi:MAG: hypothetical protein ACXWH1_15620, partial [Thermoanaerobaculia bacterium]